jgi:hypothetical protein
MLDGETEASRLSKFLGVMGNSLLAQVRRIMIKWLSPSEAIRVRSPLFILQIGIQINSQK